MLQLHTNRTETARINRLIATGVLPSQHILCCKADSEREGKTAVIAFPQLLQALLFQKHLQEQSWLFLRLCLQNRMGNGHTLQSRGSGASRHLCLSLSTSFTFLCGHLSWQATQFALSASVRSKELCLLRTNCPLWTASPHVLKSDFKSLFLLPLNYNSWNWDWDWTARCC